MLFFAKLAKWVVPPRINDEKKMRYIRHQSLALSGKNHAYLVVHLQLFSTDKTAVYAAALWRRHILVIARSRIRIIRRQFPSAISVLNFFVVLVQL